MFSQELGGELVRERQPETTVRLCINIAAE